MKIKITIVFDVKNAPLAHLTKGYGTTVQSYVDNLVGMVSAMLMRAYKSGQPNVKSTIEYED